MHCSICLNNINTTDFVKTNCSHIFHLSCLNTWLRINKSCPNCRNRDMKRVFILKKLKTGMDLKKLENKWNKYF